MDAHVHKQFVNNVESSDWRLFAVFRPMITFVSFEESG